MKSRIKYMICLVIIFLLWPHEVLVLRHGQKVILYDTIDENQLYQISSIHSVSLTPVIETYRVVDHEFINVETQFDSQGGAGLPDILKAEDRLKIKNDALIVLKNDPIELPLYILVDRKSHWQFICEDKSYSFFNDTQVVLDKHWHIGIYYIYNKVWVWINEI